MGGRERLQDYKDGYEAGLNGWRFNLDKSGNKDYLDGWNAGWKKRYFGSKQ